MNATADRIPEPARLVRDFINTLERQTDEDSLSTPEALSRWLLDNGLSSPGASASDLALARAIREGLRCALAATSGLGAPESELVALNRALSKVPVVLAFDGRTAGQGLRAARPATSTATLAPLVEAVTACRADGTWDRLKVCARDSCRWAFYDSSRNRSGRWCSMAGCGNFVKMRRAYAMRKGRPLPEPLAR